MKINLQKQLKINRELTLGFSGGADSTALALVLMHQKIPFKAVHFHHHLRAYSADQDAEFCQEFCHKNHIPLQVVDISVSENKQPQESIESAARRLRMKYWEKECSGGNKAVLLAHHQDDVVENFFIRALRGSSSSGLSGLKKLRVINGVTYLRPLLDFTKKEICEFLRAEKARWQEDESNNENIYTRNIIRNKIMPLLAEMAPVEGLYRTVKNITTDAEFIEQEAEKWLQKTIFTRQHFQQLHPALKPRVLRLYIRQHTNRDFIPGHETIVRLDREFSKIHQDTTVIPLGAGLELTLATCGEVFIRPLPFKFTWNWKRHRELILPDGARLFISPTVTHCSESFKLSELSPILTVRNRQKGDRMVPFGRQNAVKVKELFTDKKVRQSERHKLPLLFDGSELIWIPTVKRAEFGRCQANSASIIIAYERL